MTPDRPARATGISIIMPSHNPGRYLEPAARSALHQMDSCDELIIQDAVSDDGTVTVLRELEHEDPRVMAVSEADRGQSDALNRALARASGEYVLWLNADDIVADGALDAIRSVVTNDPSTDLVIGAHQILRADGSVVDTFSGHPYTIDRMIRWGCSSFSGSVAMRTDCVRAVGGFDSTLHTVMDLDLQLRLAEKAPRQRVIDDVLGALRFHSTSKSATQWSTFVRESHRVRLRHAHTSYDKARAWVTTGYHALQGVTFRMQLSPAYRSVRQRLSREGRRSGARSRGV